MKKQIILALSVLVLTIGTIAVSVSCSQEDELPTTNVDPELKAFFSTREFRAFQDSNSSMVGNMLWDKVHLEDLPNGIKLYVIPIVTNGHLKGKLNVFSKKNGRVYHSLYEDWSRMSENSGGQVRIITAEGRYISTLKYTKIGGIKFEVTIEDVVSPIDLIATRSKTRIELPNPNKMKWEDCIAQCYAVIKEIYGNKSSYDSMGLGKGYGKQTIMAICAMYCF